jgi:hypothetical protein
VNSIPSLLSFLLPIWNSDYLRGAVSGIGVLNLWVAVLEMFHFRRMTRVDS